MGKKFPVIKEDRETGHSKRASEKLSQLASCGVTLNYLLGAPDTHIYPSRCFSRLPLVVPFFSPTARKGVAFVAR